LVFKPSANVRKADQTTLSDGGRDRINAELTRLKKRREHLLTGLVSDEDTVGDSGDAADEIQQAEDVGFVDSRSPSWRASYMAAGSANTPTGLLPDGAQVTLRLADGGVTTMRVISDVAEIPESPEAGQEDETLSADSPLGLALAGHQPGDTASYETPQGPQRVQLLSVKLPPQQ